MSAEIRDNGGAELRIPRRERRASPFRRTFGVARASPAARSRLGRWVDAFLDARPVVLDVTAVIARASGELRAAREARGRRVAQADMLIPATALTHGLTLVTQNVRNFDGCGVEVVDPFT